MKFTILTALVGSCAAIGMGSHAVETDAELAQADLEDTAIEGDALAEVDAEGWLRDKIRCLKNCRKYSLWRRSTRQKRWSCNKACVIKPKPKPDTTQNNYSSSSGRYSTCDGAIRRLEDEKGRVYHSTTPYSDPSFHGVAAKYWAYQEKGQQQWAETIAVMKKNQGWKRISEIESNPKLWGSKGSPSENDITQGNLGNCWIQSAIASLAEHPDNIREMFNDRSYSQDGLFNVKLWSNGLPYWVHVDDKVPVNSHGTSYMAFKPWYGDARWAQILEKALAKYYGNYLSLEGGQTTESFYTLTGLPSMEFLTSEKTVVEMWDRLRQLDSQKCLINVSGTKYTLGIQGYHTYSILSTVTIDSETALVKMRNPQGWNEYTGPWSDKSSEMKNAIANRQVSHTDLDDGVFYMPIATFKSVFREFTVNFGQAKAWKRATKIVSIAANTSPSIQVTNPRSQHIFLGLVGYSFRQFTQDGCVDNKQNPLTYFRVKGPTNQYLDSSKDSSVMTAHPGITADRQSQQAWMMIESAAAGTYTLSSNNRRTTPFQTTVVTFASQDEMYINTAGTSVRP